MEAIIVLALPIIVTVLTQAVKSLQAIKYSDGKVAILRFVALSISFIGVVVTAIFAGEEVPMIQIETYAQALVVFFATQIPYMYGKAKGLDV